MKTLVLTLTLLMSIPVFSVSPTNGEPKKVSLKKWINQNLSYPEQAVQNKEEGIVYVSFEIKEDGTATQVKVAEGISETLDREAIELVKKMPLDEFTHNGFLEGLSYILPVKFVLK